MSDYIKREDAKEYLYRYASEEFSKRYMKFAGRLTAMQVEKIPSEDVAPVRHGRWERELGAYLGSFPRFVYHCSICGHAEEHAYADSKCSNYCPNCGARMDGDSDEID